MVQAAQSGRGANPVSPCSTDRHWPTLWGVFGQPQMRPVLVVVADVLSHQSFQVPLVHDDDVIQQVPSAAPHPTLGHSVLPRTAKGSAHGLAFHVFRRRHDVFAKFRVAVKIRNLCAGTYGHASRICCTIQSALGLLVTWKRRILRRSWPMTKKQYGTPNVSVGTVKKSMAAMASR